VGLRDELRLVGFQIANWNPGNNNNGEWKPSNFSKITKNKYIENVR
jgi:hypothetical protein